MGVTVQRLYGDGAAEIGDGFIETRQKMIGQGAVAEGVGEGGLELERPRVGCDGLIETAQCAQRIAEIAMGVRVTR